MELNGIHNFLAYTNDVFYSQKRTDYIRDRLSAEMRALHLKYYLSISYKKKNKKKLRGLSPRANYTDRATAACRRR
jgi:hypothetical protein